MGRRRESAAIPQRAEELLPLVGEAAPDAVTLALRAEVVALVEENRELRQEIERRDQARRRWRRERRRLRRMQKSYESERTLISHEIHDGLAQYLAGALMYLGSCRREAEGTSDADADFFDRGLQMLKEGHAEARRLIDGLDPIVLEHGGLAGAIEGLIASHAAEGGPSIEWVNGLGDRRLRRPLEHAVFRIVQEGLNNACRHSRSDRVRVELARRSDGGVRLIIRDWGTGFDALGIRAGAAGVAGIQRRVRLLRGRVSIRSRAGKGTRIRVDLPGNRRTTRTALAQSVTAP